MKYLYFLFSYLILLPAFSQTEDIKLSEYLPKDKILGVYKIGQRPEGFYTIDQYESYGSKDNINGYFVKKYGLSDYSLDMKLAFRIIFPKKVNNENADYKACFNVNGKYHLFVQTLQKTDNGKMVILWRLIYNEDLKVWSEPKKITERTGKWPYDRKGGDIWILYAANKERFYIFNNKVSYGNPRSFELLEYDLEYNLKNSFTDLSPAPNSYVLDYVQYGENMFFLFKEVNEETDIVQFGGVPKNRFTYWFISINLKDNKMEKFSFNPGLYELRNVNFISMNDRLVCFADITSTVESKKAYDEKDNNIGWYVADLSDFSSPNTSLLRSREFFGRAKEKRLPGILATFKYINASSNVINIDQMIPVKDGYLMFLQDVEKQYVKRDNRTYLDYEQYDDIIILKVDKSFNLVGEEIIRKHQMNRGEFYNEIGYKLVIDNNKIKLFYNDHKENLTLPEEAESIKAFGLYNLENGVFREVQIGEDGKIESSRDLLNISKEDAIVPWIRGTYGFTEEDYLFLTSQRAKKHPNEGEIKILKVSRK